MIKYLLVSCVLWIGVDEIHGQSTASTILGVEVVQYNFPQPDTASSNANVIIVDSTTMVSNYSTDIDVIMIVKDTGDIYNFQLSISSDNIQPVTFTRSYQDNLIPPTSVGAGKDKKKVKFRFSDVNLNTSQKLLHIGILDSSGQTISQSQKLF